MPLLEHWPGTRVLSTSQMPLGIPNEQVLHMRPLAVPDRVDCPVQVALENESVAFLVRRACAGDPHFALGEANVGAVTEICRQLDGLPLALQMAAGRLRVLGALALCESLCKGSMALGYGSRDAPLRQRSLEAAFRWSDELLDPLARRVLRRLSVFPGPFSIEMAKVVASDPAAGLDGWGVVDAVGTLVDHSLILVDEDALLRFRLLNTTRIVARSELDRAGELEECESRLAGMLQDMNQLLPRAA
jgi:predicted ATPase